MINLNTTTLGMGQTKIREQLRSGRAGFLDKSLYPDIEDIDPAELPDLYLSHEVVQRLAEVFGIIAGVDEDRAEIALKNLIEEVSKMEPTKSHFIHHPEMEPPKSALSKYVEAGIKSLDETARLMEASDRALKNLDNMSDAELLSELESCDSTIAYAINPEFNDDTPIQGGESPYPPFGPTVLAGKTAERFLRRMKEDGPNPQALVRPLDRTCSVKVKL